MAGSARFPWVPAYAVFEHYLVGLRRTWRAGVFSSFLLPVLTVLGFGVGVGAYIDQGVDGARHLDWLVPGLIASTALQVTVGDPTWPVFSNFLWVKTYFAQGASPLRVGDIVAGHLAFALPLLRHLRAGAGLSDTAALARRDHPAVPVGAPDPGGRPGQRWLALLLDVLYLLAMVAIGLLVASRRMARLLYT